MDRSTLIAEVISIHTARCGLLIEKNKDYATEDFLSNFKRMQKLCKVLDIDVRRSPGDNARYLMLLKMDRWCNLLSKGTPPKNESIRDTVLDLHNYIDLAYACDIEKGV
ncbi:hypothetical protein LCGC14_2474810 [marine sediment metagenome]|uniref:Uncharacterized protein n=1 Tax=marine sediment metagenome TaxID=412755 RepID=A0A0F9E352_9ZZZZ